MSGWDGYDAIAPLCSHAAACGGCAHQDRSLEDLGRWKRDRVAAALAAQGVTADIADTEMSPPQSRRRARFSALRTKKGVRLGFRRRGAHEIAPIAECYVLRPEIMAARPALEALTRLAAPRSRAIGLWVTSFENGLDVAVVDAKDLDAELRAAAARWAEESDVLRLVWNAEPIAERRAPVLRIGRAIVAPPPAAFLQATAEGEAALARVALEGTEGARRVADLFSGVGAFALRLAERSEVIAVEGEAALSAALDKALRLADRTAEEGEPGLKKVMPVTRDLYRRPLRAAELIGVDALVIDPPRAGAEAQMREIAKDEAGKNGAGQNEARLTAERIVSLSCDPGSFARDIRILMDAGWHLGVVRPIDQFLWSSHVEIAALLTR